MPPENAHTAATVLLVEDEQTIRQFIRTALRTQSYGVAEAGSVQTALAQASTCQPAIVILDLGLPDGDGAAFMQAFRHWSAAPVLVLSARSDEQQKIAALDAGADDYLTKPFAVGELLARIRALLRRSAGQTTDTPSMLAFADVRVDLAQRRVTRAGASVNLTPIEYRLLTLLMTHAGKVMTHRQLLQAVWGNGQGDRTHYLRVYVGHLRRKLESDPAQPRHFLTETAIGYRFVF